MFERYTEGARRSLFFSRYEATQRGSVSIEIEHLLLGLLREPAVVQGVLAHAQGSADDIRADVEAALRGANREPSAAVEIPFASATNERPRSPLAPVMGSPFAPGLFVTAAASRYQAERSRPAASSLLTLRSFSTSSYRVVRLSSLCKKNRRPRSK